MTAVGLTFGLESTFFVGGGLVGLLCGLMFALFVEFVFASAA